MKEGENKRSVPIPEALALGLHGLEISLLDSIQDCFGQMWRHIEYLPARSNMRLFAPDRTLDTLDELRACRKGLLLAYHDLGALHALVIVNDGFLLVLGEVLVALVLHFFASLPAIGRLNFLQIIIGLLAQNIRLLSDLLLRNDLRLDSNRMLALDLSLRGVIGVLRSIDLLLALMLMWRFLKLRILLMMVFILSTWNWLGIVTFLAIFRITLHLGRLDLVLLLLRFQFLILNFIVRFNCQWYLIH